MYTLVVKINPEACTAASLVAIVSLEYQTLSAILPECLDKTECNTDALHLWHTLEISKYLKSGGKFRMLKLTCLEHWQAFVLQL